MTRRVVGPHRKAGRKETWATGWPEDSALVALMAMHGSRRRVALALGRNHESLDRYVVSRPALHVTMCAVRPTRVRTTKEQRRARDAAKVARYRERHPERVREQNRRWAKTMDPKTRRRWNQHNVWRRRGVALDDQAREYVTVLREDPCVYCGGTAGHIDHIVAVHEGGDSGWPNLTSACCSCNGQKGAKTLLAFLAWRQHG